MQEVRIPDIGDAEDVEVIEVLVAVGDQVQVDDGLIVVESDKASMEVPSPVGGRVESIEVALGDMVIEGQLIVRLATESAVAEQEEAPAPSAQPEPVDAQQPATESANAAAPPEAEPASAPTAAAPASGGRFEVRIPDIGDAEGVEVIEVAVAAGDRVAPDDLLVVVESDKASMEIPSPVGGTVIEVPVAVGSEVAEGTLLVVLEAAEAGPSAVAEGSSAVADSPTEAPPSPAETAPPAAAPAASLAEPAPQPAPTSEQRTDASVYAGPAVRRLARELGVDLTRVSGSGDRGRILKEDVHAFVKQSLAEGGTSGATGIPELPAVDFSRFGETETVAMSRIRARGAENLHRSWLNVPHVTQHDEADVTELEAFRKSLRQEAEARGVKLTPLAFIMRAVIHALKTFPDFNASLSGDARSMILKRYYHIGFAVDTDDGLIVPVVRDADSLGVYELAERIAQLSDKARAGKLGMDELSGGSFTISSLGALGGTAFTPIVNAPEVAILGVSRLTTRPVWNGDTFEARQLLPLSLSYDHRAINGAEAGRFMVFLGGVLADIRQILL